MRSEKLIVALDFSKESDAKAMVRTLKKDVTLFKIGLQLFTKAGPAIIKAVQKGDHKVFLDLKFHDIPHTVAKSVMEATQHGVYMLTVHAMGGKEMMERAVEAANDAAEQLGLIRPKIVAVTVPTSRQDVGELGIQASVEDTVVKLAKLAHEAGCDGVVCSPREINVIRAACGPDFLIVTPGIRLGDEEADDQKRVDTPKAAFEAGANYIVVGRPILRASDPVRAVQKINASVHGLDPHLVAESAPEEAPPPEEPAPEVTAEPTPESAPEPALEKPVEEVTVAPAVEAGDENEATLKLAEEAAEAPETAEPSIAASPEPAAEPVDEGGETPTGS